MFPAQGVYYLENGHGKSNLIATNYLGNQKFALHIDSVCTLIIADFKFKCKAYQIPADVDKQREN